MNRYLAAGCAAMGIAVGYTVAQVWAIERVDRLLVRLANTRAPDLDVQAQERILRAIGPPRVVPIHGRRHPSRYANGHPA